MSTLEIPQDVTEYVAKLRSEDPKLVNFQMKKTESGMGSWIISQTLDPQKNVYAHFYKLSVPHPKTVCVVRFGENTQGPPLGVHGGALATLIDHTCSVSVVLSKKVSVTLQLNIKYKKFVPVNQWYLIEAVPTEKEKDKLIQVDCTLKSVDGKTIFCEAQADFLVLDREFVRNKSKM